MNCTSCGAPLAAGARFCGGCGRAVGSTVQPPRQISKNGVGCGVLAGIVLSAMALYSILPGSTSTNDTATAAKQAADVERHRKGFHCLDDWGGSNSSLVDQVKADLRDPDSFQHIETRITPVVNGEHLAIMRYRAHNGFGGMNLGTARAIVDTKTCAATIVATSDG